MRLVSTSMIKPDMVLAKSIYYRDCLILKAGQTDIAKFCKNLKRMGIEYVYVEDDKSEGIIIPDAVSEQTRVACKKVLRETVDNFARNSTMEFEYISDVVDNVINDILLNKDVQVSLNDISATDEYTFTHSVSTTVYSLLIAKQLNYSRSMLKKLAAGTLLHDLGKVLLDKKILFKEGQLTEEEFEYVKTHTTLGYHALKSCNEITELSRIISLFHHERMDGSGYPRGVKAGDLHEFARIVAIADVYDALTSDRCYRKRWSNQQAVNYLIESADTKFDTNLVAIFIQQIAIYPNGAIVRLSNGLYGIVKDQNRSVPLRPIVRIIADEKGNDIRPMYEINLLDELAITIVESEIEIDKGV
ncbi:HD-hydrolase domain [Lachnospiraceae bacterium KM106-2]|nr:HD-hydrolase domain [Lachnospiraceae bacterium KM106-2]